jgi:hypothetical protein
MQNTFKKFLLLNSLILAQFCFLTAQVNKQPEVISDSKESYSQKIQLDLSHHNSSENNILKTNLENTLIEKDFSYLLFFLSLITFSFFVTIKATYRNTTCYYYKIDTLLKTQYYNCWYKTQSDIYLIIKILNQYLLSLFNLEKDTLEYIK